MKQHYLLSLSTLFLLSGCLSSPQPVEYSQLKPYKSIESACQKRPPETLKNECTQLLSDLTQEREYLNSMHAIKEDEKQEPTYIDLADKASMLSLKLHADKTLLAQKCQSQMSMIVANDDLNSAAFCLLFDENTLSLEGYQYLKTKAPQFDNNAQFIAFEKKYSQEKILEGLSALNKGDKKSALQAFKVAYSAHNPEAAFLIGIIYEEKQIKKAIAWHKKAVNEGVKLSNVNLARLYLRIKLPAKAKAYYLSAAKDGSALAQYRLFKMDSKSKSAKARADAQLWLKQSAANNYPQAQYILGLQLFKKKHLDEAKNWLEKAHANGITETNFYLGKLYYQEQSYAKAFDLLFKARDKGEANYLLAVMFEKGLGVKKNSVASYRYYKKAHEQAHDNHVPDMKRLQRHLTKRERIAAKYIGKKILEHDRQERKHCGPFANSKNITKENKTIHIVGVAVKPIDHANGFIVYGDHERLYYIIDAKMADEIKAYRYVSLKTKATGKAISISSDTGSLQPIYQFKTKAVCQ